MLRFAVVARRDADRFAAPAREPLRLAPRVPAELFAMLFLALLFFVLLFFALLFPATLFFAVLFFALLLPEVRFELLLFLAPDDFDAVALEEDLREPPDDFREAPAFFPPIFRRTSLTARFVTVATDSTASLITSVIPP